MARFRRARAADLRARTTRTERALWAALTLVPLEGTHFRRQVSLGRYVVDFACLASRLIIELDGASHSRDGAAERDRSRQAWLEAEGFRVLRFWNDEVDQNLDGVLATIYAALYGSLDAEATRFVHKRRPRSRAGDRTPPQQPAAHPSPDLRSDPPPAGEG